MIPKPDPIKEKKKKGRKAKVLFLMIPSAERIRNSGTDNRNTVRLQKDPGTIKNIPWQGADLRERKKGNQPLWPGMHRALAIHDAVDHSYAASPGAHTCAAAEAGGPGTGPSRAPEVGKGSRGEGRWGCWPEGKDL